MLVLEMTPIAISTSTGGTASTSNTVYAGTGADSVLITNGANLTVYADGSATDTAGGADSLQVTALTSSTVYGAAGGDTLNTPQGFQRSFRSRCWYQLRHRWWYLPAPH